MASRVSANVNIADRSQGDQWAERSTEGVRCLSSALAVLICRAETDLISPTVLRSLCNIKAVKVLTGPSANYAIILDGASLNMR